MKNFIFLFMFLWIINLFFFSCNPIDNSSEVNNIITNSGHFEEPPEYSPIFISSDTTTESYDETSYQKIENKYKYAQKFEDKTIADFSQQKNLKSSDNDIFLGAIIQGKYWFNDGELISIGDFPRNSLDITLTGVTLNGLNSTTAYPSKSDMTEAIKFLTNNSFEQNSNNIEYTITNANSSEQISLKFGLLPKWLDNIGLNFDFSNTYSNNTVYLYFKQIYYTISAELPAEPADFFANDVDIEALNSKITKDNPAGYVSSIDYGRVIVLKMNSSYTKTEMKAALNAAFKALSVNIESEYTTIIDNSSFDIKIFGGDNITQIPNTLEDVMSIINEGLTIENLANAMPICYHIHYLDGAPFNIGEEIEYTETEYKILNANTMTIKKITITQLPHMVDGYWEPGIGGGSWPDVYFTIYNNGQTIYSTSDNYYNETTSTMLENNEIYWGTNFDITDFNSLFSIKVFDHDSGEDDYMTEISFTVNEDILNSDTYPESVTLYNSEEGIRVTLQLSWK